MFKFIVIALVISGALMLAKQQSKYSKDWIKK